MADTPPSSRLIKLFFWATVAAGTLISAFCIYRLQLQHLDLRFAIIVAITLLVSSRIIIPIPRFSSHISVSDTFIFLLMLLYGLEPAVLEFPPEGGNREIQIDAGEYVLIRSTVASEFP